MRRVHRALRTGLEPAGVLALVLADHPLGEPVRGQPGAPAAGRHEAGGGGEHDAVVVRPAHLHRGHHRKAVGADPAEHAVGQLRRRFAALTWSSRGPVPLRGALWGAGGSAGSGSPCTSGVPAQDRSGQTTIRSTARSTCTRRP